MLKSISGTVGGKTAWATNAAEVALVEIEDFLVDEQLVGSVTAQLQGVTPLTDLR